MLVAILGYSGAGKSTLARAVAGQNGVRPAHSLEQALHLVEAFGDVVLDGVPSTMAELARLDTASAAGDRIEHFLFLQAPADTRADRIARSIAASGEPAESHQPMLHPVELQELRRHLESSGRLVTIDASRTRSEVLSDALAAVGLPI